MIVSRDDTLPEDLLIHLRRAIPALNEEPFLHQFALARMLWLATQKRRDHAHFDDAASFHFEELDRTFGRGRFLPLNERLEFFRVSPNWSKAGGWTKGYWFTPHIEQVRAEYLAQDCTEPTQLVRSDGSVQRTLPRAVAAKDQAGKTTRAWTSAAGLNRVLINLEAVRRLKATAAALHSQLENKGRAAETLKALNALGRIGDAAAQILRLATTTVAGRGVLPHRYEEAASGRLYAKGINLQNAPRIVKQAALEGFWEYDLANCHFTILNQMASQFGFDCNAIRHYVRNKPLVRSQIAAEAEITVDDTKTCLLALMYGARATTWHANAIPSAIGAEAAQRLYNVALFRAIKTEVDQARNAILSEWPRTANGGLTNAMGKAISGKARPAEKMSHLIQGVEAKALNAVIQVYPHEIVLLQHDGFAAACSLDSDAILCAIYQATGFHFALQENQLRFDESALIEMSRIQNRT